MRGKYGLGEKKRTVGGMRASKAKQNEDDSVKALGVSGQRPGPNEHSNVACEKVSGGLQRGSNQHKNTRTS